MLSESDWNPSCLNTSHQNRSSDHNPSNFNTSHLNTYDYNIPSNLNTSHLSTGCNNKSNVNISHLSTSSDYNPSNLALILRTFHPITTIQGGVNLPGGWGNFLGIPKLTEDNYPLPDGQRNFLQFLGVFFLHFSAIFGAKIGLNWKTSNHNAFFFTIEIHQKTFEFFESNLSILLESKNIAKKVAKAIGGHGVKK